MIRFASLLAAAALFAAPAFAQPRTPPAPLTSEAPLPPGVSLTEARWFSEQVEVSGRLFTPQGFGESFAAPAVVLAPGWGETADSLDIYAADLAGAGLVALSVDYRGWGRSGGFIYLNERLDTYDAKRFSDVTAEVAIRRGRLEPELQIQDLRNALTYLQSLPGVDRDRLGVLGVDRAGGHVISVLGMDARVDSGVAITPLIPGADDEPLSYVPPADIQRAMVELAREGAPPQTNRQARRRNRVESEIALAQYKPFWRIEAIPEEASVLLLVAGDARDADSAADAEAAAAALGDRAEVAVLEGARNDLGAAGRVGAAQAAAAWFGERL